MRVKAFLDIPPGLKNQWRDLFFATIAEVNVGKDTEEGANASVTIRRRRSGNVSAAVGAAGCVPWERLV